VRAWEGHSKKPHPWQEEALAKAMGSLLKSLDGTDERGVIHAATGTGKSLVQVEIAKLLLRLVRQNERIIVSVPSQDLVDQMYKDLNERIPSGVRKWYQYERKLDRPIIVACHKSMMEGRPRCLTCRPFRPSEIKRRQETKLPVVPLEGSALRMTSQALRCGHQNIVLCPSPNSLGVAMFRKALRVRFWIADEIHQTENLRVLSWAGMMRPDARIGFTATPYRTNEKEAISLFEDLLFSYGIQRAIQDEVIVPPRFVFYQGESRDLDIACLEMIQDTKHIGVGIVNAWDCEDADAYAELLRMNNVRAESIHSRQRKSVQRQKLRMLRQGRLDCLVHVNLLSEGRNFPWLSWLCLRRSTRRYGEDGEPIFATMSRTRYVQEIGRVLRRWKNKREAIILDPSGLSADLQLFYEERLGIAEETPSIRLQEKKPSFAKLAEESEEEYQERLAADFGIVLLERPLSEKSPVALWLAQERDRLLREKAIPIGIPRCKQNKNGRDPLVQQYTALHLLLPDISKKIGTLTNTALQNNLRRALVLALKKRLNRKQMQTFLAIALRTEQETKA